MANANTPLLASDREGEEDALTGSTFLTTRAANPSRTRNAWLLPLREALLFIWALLATAAVLVLAVWVSRASQSDSALPDGKRNLVFMVSDGMGPASLSLTRSFRQYTQGLDFGDVLTLDKHFWGSSRTRSNSSLVTDSAAGATAFSCAKKSYNGAISILPDHSPCGTVLEAAKRAGYMTGLVVTTDITDATPACFSSHVDYRSQEDEIALQQLGQGPLDRVVDLMFGGGRCHFLPNSTEGSCRDDDVDAVKIAQEKYGWNYMDTRAAFDELWEGKKDVPLPMMGLFAPTDIPFELDRRNMNEIYPSLNEMATTALRALEKATANSDRGFFLMIEGSRVDHAGHGNDPAAQVWEVLEYDKTVKTVLDFLEDSKTEGVMVSTSDHETGGLSVAKQLHPDYPQYLWYPAVLANASSSSEFLAHKLHRHNADLESNKDAIKELKHWINQELVITGLGIKDADDDELSALASRPADAQKIFAKMISDRAQIGWSTHGHSAVDVNIYSSGGPGTNAIRGNVENTEVGEFLRSYLDVDLDAVTRELNEKSTRAGSVASIDSTASRVDESEDHWASHEAVERARE